MTIVMQLGLTMAGCIAFCFWAGYELDKWLGTRGVFITIGTLLGVAGGANVCYRAIMDLTRDSGKGDKGEKSPEDKQDGTG
ncbi:AtpZ/AtpI family protein [Desulfatibacillum aliphaticivorans]|uniref:AtpZ/AtpI family protein n=1 Tax=Desulfatibacillum aliphaticivorans TaxID=218208 RepID=UPI000A0655AA|nr:AtpZ/AtpI family protein [Desulfatibacillum aliphaticivorans]